MNLDDYKQLKDFWESLSDFDKHLDDRLKWGQSLHSRILSFLPEIKTVMDYGSGGGWVSLGFEKNSQIILVDIVEKNLIVAKNRLIKKHFSKVETVCSFDEYSFPIHNEFEKYKNKLDLIMCFLVINHFPSYYYYNIIVRFWEWLNPTYIAIQWRNLKKRMPTNTIGLHEFEFIDDYKKKFGIGLLMNEEYAMKPFNNYEKIFYLEDVNEKISYFDYCYCILKRRPNEFV